MASSSPMRELLCLRAGETVLSPAMPQRIITLIFLLARKAALPLWREKILPTRWKSGMERASMTKTVFSGCQRGACSWQGRTKAADFNQPSFPYGDRSGRVGLCFREKRSGWRLLASSAKNGFRYRIDDRPPEMKLTGDAKSAVAGFIRETASLWEQRLWTKKAV